MKIIAYHFFRLALLSFFLLTISITAFAQQDDHPFELEIKAFKQADARQMPAAGGILFVGSSSVRMWKSLEQDFPENNVINREFGGSTFGDLLYYMDRIVPPYLPRQIFVYEGDNDVWAGVSISKIHDRFQTFVHRVHREMPETEIVFISIKPSPSRQKVFEKMHRANLLIKSYALMHDRVRFADVFSAMLTADGGIKPDIFIEDNLHMNAKGYDIWQRVIRPYLD